MISTQTQKVFALAMIAFAMPSNALKAQATAAESCDELYSGEIRNPVDHEFAFTEGWESGFY